MRELVPGIKDVQVSGRATVGYDMYVSVFLCTEGPTTLIDTGWPDTTDEVLAALEEEVDDVERVLVTHEGSDHYGGLDAVMERYDPEFLAPAAETTLFEYVDHEPDVELRDGDRLDGGIEIVQIPGHKPGPASLYFPDKKVLIAADVLDGSDRRGLPEGYLLPPPAQYNDDHTAAELNLEKLLEYDIETVLVYHGSHVMNGANEKLERLVNFDRHFHREAKIAADEDGR